MPSGAKKRKAAKKKREQEANNNNNSSVSTNNPQGNDDPKSHDERESDGGEVGSPVSQDQHNHQHPFNEGNGQSEKGGPLPSDSLADQNKPMEVVTGDAEGSLKVESEDNIAVNIEREVNSKQNVESKNVLIEHVDSSKESHDEDDRSSSSSFSNESQAFEKKSKEANDEEKENGSFSEEVKQIPENEKPVKEADSNSVLETASADLVHPVVPISETAKVVIEIAQVENPEVLEVVESGFEDDEDKLLPVSNDIAVNIEREVNSKQNVESKNVFIEQVDSSKESHDEDDRSSSSSSFSNESQAFEKKSKEAKDEEKENGSFSEEVKQIPENEKPVKEADSNSVLETASADLVNPVVPISETAKVVVEIAQVENPEVLEVVESGFEDDEDKLLPVSNEIAEVSPAIVVPKKNEDKVFPISDENVRASANVVPSSAYGNVGKTLVSSVSHSDETGNGEEKTKYTDAHQSTENKPLLACGPRVAERTLWMSCCGIFDVLTGSK
ncbi:nucleolin 2-like [Populus nigra]|uniref:nucleolin 2-like n=1 Tax=Populus nigra TaxID=3691 RepID=UPI002B26F250|nr:nucleolin 2-like [Populus nigra]XP_061948585.1 nucleolin 2-like [Populus nigra]